LSIAELLTVNVLAGERPAFV